MSALDELIARDSGMPAGGISALDALISRDGGTPELPAAQAPATSKEATLYDKVGRQVGLTTRAGITALTGLPTMLGDAANSTINLGSMGINALTGSHIPQLKLPSSIVQEAMNSAGIPQPSGAQENIVQGITAGMGSAGPGVALGRALGQASGPVVKAIGDGLAALPGMQMAGGAGAGAGSAIAKEAGLGPMGQLAAALGGGVVGAITPSAALATARGVSNVSQGVKGAIQPVVAPQKFVGQQLAKALGEDASTVAQNIRTAPEYVPNSRPTTAQAGGTPLLVATEKNAANADPAFKLALNAHEAANNSARWDAIYGLAKTPADLAEAIAARQAKASPIFNEAHQSTAPITQDFLDLARRPAMIQAMKEANVLAQNEGKAFKWPTPQDTHIDGAALDYTTRALSNMIGKAKTSNATQDAAALQGIQTQLKAWAESNIPKVAEAKAAYREMSTPVNTLQAAQQLAERLGNNALNTNREPQITLNSYRAAMARALKAQKYGIDPEAEHLLGNISTDLQRGTVSNSLKSPGSDTAYNISADGWLARQLYGSEFNGASALGKGVGAVGATLSGHPMVGMGILAGGKKLGQAVGDNLNKELQQLLLNPEALLPYLDAPGKKSPQALAQALGRNVSQGALGASAGSAAKP